MPCRAMHIHIHIQPFILVCSSTAFRPLATHGMLQSIRSTFSLRARARESVQQVVHQVHYYSLVISPRPSIRPNPRCTLTRSVVAVVACCPCSPYTSSTPTASGRRDRSTSNPFLIWASEPACTSAWDNSSRSCRCMFVCVVCVWLLDFVCFCHPICSVRQPVCTFQCVLLARSGRGSHKRKVNIWFFVSLFLFFFTFFF